MVDLQLMGHQHHNGGKGSWVLETNSMGMRYVVFTTKTGRIKKLRNLYAKMEKQAQPHGNRYTYLFKYYLKFRA